MSKDPSQPEQGEASQPQASTSGTNQQTQSSKDGTNPASESTNRPAQRDSGADSATAGHSGNGEQSKEEKNETPDELRQELDQLRRDLAASLQKKQSLDRQLVCLLH